MGTKSYHKRHFVFWKHDLCRYDCLMLKRIKWLTNRFLISTIWVFSAKHLLNIAKYRCPPPPNTKPCRVVFRNSCRRLDGLSCHVPRRSGGGGDWSSGGVGKDSLYIDDLLWHADQGQPTIQRFRDDRRSAPYSPETNDLNGVLSNTTACDNLIVFMLEPVNYLTWVRDKHLINSICYGIFIS